VEIDYDTSLRSSTGRIAFADGKEGEARRTISGAASENRAIRFRPA